MQITNFLRTSLKEHSKRKKEKKNPENKFIEFCHPILSSVLLCYTYREPQWLKRENSPTIFHKNGYAMFFVFAFLHVLFANALFFFLNNEEPLSGMLVFCLLISTAVLSITSPHYNHSDCPCSLPESKSLCAHPCRPEMDV